MYIYIRIHFQAILPQFPTCKITEKKGKVKSLNRVSLLVTPWTVARQAPLSMEFSGQGYWSGLPCLPPGDLLDPEIRPGSPALQADSLPSGHQGSPKSVKVLVTQSFPKF